MIRSTPRLTDRRIGLLGGSFNPAHEGHVHVSLEALKRLGLDEVWWLVSPQNPLKAATDMAGLDRRMARARAIAAAHRRLRVTDLERALGTRYTIDTVRALRRHHPRARFVWLMGADNLKQLPRWKDWAALVEAVPIAVIDRPGFAPAALSGAPAHRYAGARLRPGAARSLADRAPPAWTFLYTRLNPLSATALRNHET
ncbi:MAG: nicotinate-nucleotide adenylyltransferase [Alphaproteobacteria bacterium]|nr:nicotinate-nucleotide adenylyltransferase [Alphaproteobacteria bacterium]MCW5740494.1 nicotinate-nucleotide adenylyltransferase [Alphaproteobacteria bacterium]